MVAIGKKAVNLRITENTTHGTLTENLLKEVKDQMLAEFYHKLTQKSKAETEAHNHFIRGQILDIFKALIPVMTFFAIIAVLVVLYNLSQFIKLKL